MVVSAESSMIPRATPRNTQHAMIFVKAVYDGRRMYRKVAGTHEEIITARVTKENVTVALKHANTIDQKMAQPALMKTYR